jgi:hypothetical protein
MKEWKGRIKLSWPVLKYYSNISLKKPNKTTSKINQNDRPLGS